MADPTALYSYQGQAPAPLPEKILLSDGRKRTNVSSYSDEEILDAGFTGPYGVPNYDQEYQRVLWNSETLSFVLEDISDEELWEKIREKRNNLLKESDWIMICDIPGDKDINLPEWTLYRHKLRNLPATTLNPKEIVWPLKPNETEILSVNPPILELSLRNRVEDLESSIENLKLSNQNKTSRIQDLEDRIATLENLQNLSS
jgi:hypothetical protein